MANHQINDSASNKHGIIGALHAGSSFGHEVINVLRGLTERFVAVAAIVMKWLVFRTKTRPFLGATRFFLQKKKWVAKLDRGYFIIYTYI